MRRRWAITIVAGALAFASAHVASAGAAPAARRWVRETGNGYDQSGAAVAVDADGNAFVAGTTNGKFPKSGDPVSHRASTGFLAAYNRRGGLDWSTQFGTADTHATGVARDAAGNLDVAGSTRGPGAFPGAPEEIAGDYDAFVVQYSAGGDHAWTHLLGSTDDDRANGVAVDSNGALYVVGTTVGALPGAPESLAGENDAWIAKYSQAGALVWVHTFGTAAGDTATAVAAADGNGVDVTGVTRGDLAGPGSHIGGDDIFVAHFDADGTLGAVHQYGGDRDDRASGIALDQYGDRYVAGITYGALPGWHRRGDRWDGDGFLLALDPDGAVLASAQIRGPGPQHVNGVALDGVGDIYVAGMTASALAGAPEPYSSYGDAFVARFNGHGFGELRQAWVHLVGSDDTDGANAVAATHDGLVTVTGSSGGVVPGAPRWAGATDVLVARFARVS